MKKTTVLALLCLALLAPGAGAQSTGTAAASATTLREVVVSARQPQDAYVPTGATGALKSAAPLIETPASVAVVTREQMDERNVQTIGQINRYTPGVITETQGDDHRSDSSTYIRGFLSDKFLDGLKMQGGAFTFPTIDPYFLQSAEVLYGPNSILYGNASPGGILNLVSKAPQAAEFHEVQYQMGSDDLFQGAFDSTGKLDRDGHFLYRVTGLGRTEGTEVDFTHYQRLEIAPSVTWKPDADTTLTVTVNVLDDPQAGFFRGLPAMGTILPNNTSGQIPRSTFLGDPDFTQFNRQQYSLGYQFERKVNEVFSVRQNFRYVDQQLNYADVYPVQSPQASLLSGGSLINRDAFHVWENLNAVDVDTQGVARFGTGPVAHEVLFGLDYQNNVWAERYQEGAAPALNYLNPVYTPITLNPTVSNTSVKHSIDQEGLYAQDTLKWERWVLNLGGREDWYSDTNLNRLTGVKTYTGAQASTMRTGVLYAFPVGLSPYFNYAQSFQPVSGATFSGATLQPSRGEQEEVGLKYQPKGFPGFFSVSFYNLDQKNVAATDPAHTSFLVQNGSQKSEGTEFLSNVTPVKGWNLTGGYSYLDARVTASPTAGLTNKIPVGQAHNRAMLWSDYTFQDGWLKGFGLGGGVRYVGDAWADTLNTVPIADYTLFDAAAHYDFGPSFPALQGLKAAVNVSNLFDREYILASQTGSVGAATANLGTAWYGEGRTIQGVLTYRW